MNFKNILIKSCYRTAEDDVIKDFFIPVLKCAKTYKRAAGFFSSSALVRMSVGISGLINNNGKMQLVVSPNLSQEDIDAIKKGYEKRADIINRVLIRSLDEELAETEMDRLNLMISLIENGILDIKIAILDEDSDFGMYHEKIGIIEDVEGNKLAFTGSYNESMNSYVKNFESLDVYSTLTSEYSRVQQKEDDFNRLWNNSTEKLVVEEFPEAVKKHLFDNYYNREKVLSENAIIKKEEIAIKEKRIGKPDMPSDFLRDYQKEAIENWKGNNYRGVFDMATGTGKTLTALGAAIRLLKEKQYNLGIVIICPYTHLVEQWVEDLQEYNFSPLVGYGSMSNNNWKLKLKDEILSYKIGISNYFCFITTNATYCSKFIQEQLKKVENKDILFIADEAHNVGASNLLNNLNYKFKYRLALSATFERYGDEEGTEKSFEYFGNYYCIHYSLRQAINNGMLTPYKYYPIVTYLSDDELEEYNYLTTKASKYIKRDKKGNIKIGEQGKLYLLKRARLVAGAREKLDVVINLLREEQKVKGQINNTLIYCGATTVNDPGYKEEKTDEGELKQVDYLREKIEKELNINVSRFTSRESQEDRKLIKDQFISNDVNAIVAIKCLDEGVNIPSIHTAFILASSTNPREYVQRRGRVLRLAKGKNFAEIYDFITLPRNINERANVSEEELKGDLGLIRREMARINEFAEESLNYSSSQEIYDKINSVYGKYLYKYKEEIVE